MLRSFLLGGSCVASLLGFAACSSSSSPVDSVPPPERDAGAGDRSDASAPTADGAAPADAGSRADGEAPPADTWTGSWRGKAVVAGGKFLKKGTFDVELWIVHESGRVRGFLDSNQTPAGNIDSPSHYVEGTIDSSGALELELTERVCGAGEPEGLCYPSFSSSRALVYQVQGTRTGDKLQIGQAKVKPGAAPLPNGISFEAPFESMSLDRVLTPNGAPGTSITGTWSGECNLPRDVVFNLPAPADGPTAMDLTATAMTRFTVDGTDWWPSDEPFFLGDTFRFEPTTGRFWVRQLSSIYSSLVYIGRIDVNVIDVVIYSDDITDPKKTFWKAGSPAPALMAPPFENVEGMCRFARQ